MAAQIIPVGRSRALEIWHDASTPRSGDEREDRIVAVSVELPRGFRVAVCDPEASADWPAPVIMDRARSYATLSGE